MGTVIRIRPDVSTAPTADGPLPVMEIVLGGTPRGAVLMLCDAGSLEHAAADVLNGLAEHGYSALAAEPRPAGAGGLGPDAVALLARLREQGWVDAQIGVVGYGSGAATALAVATRVPVGAAVGLAASPLAVPARAVLQAPWLGMYSGGGQHDASLRAWLDRQSVYSRLVTYPGTADTCYRTPGRTEDRVAAFDAWQRTVEWLNLRVEPRPTPLAERWAAAVGCGR